MADAARSRLCLRQSSHSGEEEGPPEVLSGFERGEQSYGVKRIDQRRADSAGCCRRHSGTPHRSTSCAGRCGLPGPQRQTLNRRCRRRRYGQELPGRLQGREYRRPMRPRLRVRRAGVQDLPDGQDLQGFPADVRQRAEELRRFDRRHAGSLALAHRAGGPGDGQAPLQRQADHAHDCRGEEGQGGVPRFESHDQGEHSRFPHELRASHHRTAAYRGHRSNPGSPHLDPHLQSGRLGEARGTDAAGGHGLGCLVRPLSVSAVPQDLPLRELAYLVGFRNRHGGRLRLPHAPDVP